MLYDLLKTLTVMYPSMYFWHMLLHALKGIVHFEINFWYVLAYLKGIQDVGVFVYF